MIHSGTAMQTPPMIHSGAIAYGLATIAKDGTVLDTWYPTPELAEGVKESGSHVLSETDARTHLGEAFVKTLGPCELRGVNVVAVKTNIATLAEPAKDTHDVFLRLHLLSHRLVKPHQANLAGIFGMLANVAWTSMGPCPLDQLQDARLRARAARVVFDVKAVDKFPYMTDYVVPSGVRIANVDRVRLGAHLASGTTVMHEGFCNFNAGTLGASMVEGRIKVMWAAAPLSWAPCRVVAKKSSQWASVVCWVPTLALAFHWVTIAWWKPVATSLAARASKCPMAAWSRRASCLAAMASCSAAIHNQARCKSFLAPKAGAV
ncbi:MAG: 2,3,4,5-tetrahydropyridine-2,6-dicarboxylate N-succinyltransferase [Pseudomonadota bacterium]